MATVFRSLYKVKRVELINKPKSFPIGEKGSKVMFNVTIYKCVDPESTETDRREKIICSAVEKEWKGGRLSNEKQKEEEAEKRLKEERLREQQKNPGKSKPNLFKRAAASSMLTNIMKVSNTEDAFGIVETSGMAVANSTKNADKGDLAKYRAHLRMLNLKVNPVARDFVVHENEWMALRKAALKHEQKSGRPLKIVEEEMAKNPMKIVADFISSRLCIRSTYDTIENERQRVLTLPAIQGIRDKAVAEMMEDYASRRIQRIFRGFHGRAKMKRMIFRFRQKKEQHEVIKKTRKRMADRRQYRAWCASVVQARIKGIVWRRRLMKMQYAALRIQTVYRGFSVRGKAREEQRKKLEGARVITVYKRGRVVSGVHLLLTVRRCGLSFKLVGRSEQHMDTFVGYVYRENCAVLVDAHNSSVDNKLAASKAEEEAERQRIADWGYDEDKQSADVQNIHMMQNLMGSSSGEGGSSLGGKVQVEDISVTRVKHWQHDKVLQVVLDNLALVDPIKACSFDMAKQEGKKVLICNPELGAEARGPGILKFNGQKRILKDQRRAIGRYEKDLKKRHMHQEALGKPLDLY